MTEEFKIFGLKPEILIGLLIVIILIMAVFLIACVRKIQYISRKYHTLMSGKGGKDLEKMIYARFRDMEKIKVMAQKVNKEHKGFKAHLDASIDSIGLVKYNAFEGMAGDLSSAICFLDHNKSGIILNTLNTDNGCRTYVKEVVSGASPAKLSKEETLALEKAISKLNVMEPDIITNDEDYIIDSGLDLEYEVSNELLNYKKKSSTSKKTTVADRLNANKKEKTAGKTVAKKRTRDTEE